MIRPRLTTRRLGAAIAVITAAVYLPVLANHFVVWDDGLYIVDNPHIRSLNWSSLEWMLTTFRASNYHPLTWLSHAIDIQLWGLNPAGHHLTNLLLHAANTGLVFLVAHSLILLGMGVERRTPRTADPALLPAAVTALLFGLHPLHVESVAWAAERKDVLCALFYLLALRAYLSYATPSPEGRRGRAYGAALLLFALALLAKPMAITLPVVLLLLDLFPLRRLAQVGWRRLIVEKLPLFLLAAAAAVVTVAAAASRRAMTRTYETSLASRAIDAAEEIFFYLGKMVWPIRLSPMYEAPLHPHPWLAASAVVAVVAMTAAAIFLWRRDHRALLATWGYYVITLLPVLGIVAVGWQWAADRYTYLPSLAPFLLVGLGVDWAWRAVAHRSLGQRSLAGGLAALLVIALAGLTVRQIRVWRDEETLWRHAVEVAPDNADFARLHLYLLYKKKRHNQAMEQAYRSMRPGHAIQMALTGEMGRTLAKEGRLSEATATLRQALRYQPKSVRLRIDLGHVYLLQRNITAAEAILQKAIQLDPKQARAHTLLGEAYAMAGNNEAAVQALTEAIRLDPQGEPTAYTTLAIVDRRLGKIDAAVEVYRRALSLPHPSPRIALRLSHLLYQQGDLASARRYADLASAQGVAIPEAYRRALSHGDSP